MNKIYYGKGTCSLQATNIIGIEIRKRGAISIIDKTSNNYYISANEKKIIIFPAGIVQPLTDLFEYRGDFKILSVMAADINGEKQPIVIKRQMHYSEMMDSNAEDITLNSENLNAGYRYKNKMSKTKVDINIIKNLQSKGNLYLDKELTTPYLGVYHIHISENRQMTGADHTKESQNLYMKTKTKTKRTPRRTTSRGTSGGGGY